MDLYCVEWVINLRPYKQQKIILSGTCRALEVKLIKWLSSWPLPLRLIIFKLETVNTNLKKVEGPDGSLQMVLCMFVSFSSLSSLICLSLACPAHRMNLALPGRNLVHIPALAWFAGAIQTAGNFPSATGAGQGSQIFPLRGTFFFFLSYRSQTDPWNQIRWNAVFLPNSQGGGCLGTVGECSEGKGQRAACK